MVKERDPDDSSDDALEPDNTLIQPDDPGSIDRTLVQRSGPSPADPGVTMPQRSIDATIRQGSDEAATPAPATSDEAATLSSGAASASRAAQGDKPKVFARRFEVIERLGSGGMGVVYRARDREIEGREIALKVLRPRFSNNAHFRELFFKEIHAAQGFVSEHVVQVRDTGKTDDGTLYLTMDLVDGEPLDGLLERESSLNQRHALEIARQTLVALGSGHEHGFVHRDVKPQNIMLTARVPKTDDNPFGVGVRLLDFGIAGLVAQVGEGEIIGTPRYMSPEQVQGQRLDARSDLFAVGIVLYEMLSGTRPFDGTTPQEVSTAILETNVTPLIMNLEDLSQPVRKILRKALQKNRDKRFQSAGDFIRAIEKSSAFRAPRAVPGWVAAMLVATLAGAGAEGYLLWDTRKGYDRLLEDRQTLADNHARELREYEQKLGIERAKVAELRTKTVEATGSSGDAAVRADTQKQLYEEQLAINQQLQTDNRQLQREMERLKEQMQRFTKRESDEFKAARFFDRIIGLVEEGSPALALERFREGRDAMKLHWGVGHIEQVVGAAAALAAARSSLSTPDGEPVAAEELPVSVRNEAFEAHRRGSKLLADALAGKATFEVECQEWIEEDTSFGEQPVDRRKILDGIRNDLLEQSRSLDTRISSIKQLLAASLESEIESFRQLGVDDDPTPLIQHLRGYPGDFAGLADVVDRLGAETEKKCAGVRGLTLEALTGAPHLAKWGEYLLGDGAAVAGKGADTFRWLTAARIWYSGQDLDPAAFAFVKNVPEVRNTEPHADWRARLALQVAFAGRIGQFLTAGSGVNVYRHKVLRSGATDWYRDDLAPTNGNTWEIVRRRIDEDGQFARPQSISVLLTDNVIYIADTPTLDVRAYRDHAKVAFWKPSLVEPLPDQTWARQMPHKRFRESIGDGLVCLVFEVGDARYWFAPGHGLVRQEVIGSYERELCFSDRVQ